MREMTAQNNNKEIARNYLAQKAGLFLQSGQWFMSLTNFLRLMRVNFSSSITGGKEFTSTAASGGPCT